MEKIMRLFIIVILCVSVVCFSACDKNNDSPYQNEKPYDVTVTFDTTGFDCDTPAPIRIRSNELPILPYPEVKILDDGYKLAWFVDPETTVLFDDSSTISKDVTLYLGYSPKSYSITYTNAEDFTFDIDLPTSYVYGKGVSLPQSKAELGYVQGAGKWLFDGGYFTTGISGTTKGDLTLTYEPTLVKYKINYYYLEGATNPNPTEYDVTMGTLVLEPISVEGKTFLYWEIRTTKTKRRVETVDMDTFTENGVVISIWAVWEE